MNSFRPRYNKVIMLSKTDFESTVWDFLFTYRQFLLNGYLHKRVNHEAYEANPPTWNTLLLSLEAGTVLGLAKILERKKDMGRSFGNDQLDVVAQKIENLRNGHFAHNDLSKKRSDSFLTKNRVTGSDVVNMIDALKKRLIEYQKSIKLDIDVQKLFTESQNNAVYDLDAWLKSFKSEL